ncbi:MAG: pyruvate formate lyase-activating protein [Thermoprotei archaeon]|nr:MAG: pyruvate formate lyase-activating protein [Thermoprotei archaeon]RLE77337.1 MAG: pyruvate formate lyase-activating protein [Thermoprotei archaeon]
MWMLIRPDALNVWGYPEVKKRLNHYYLVMKNRRPAKYLVVKKIDAEINPKDLETNDLWSLHSKLSKNFENTYKKILNGEEKLDEIPVPEYSFLDLKIELVERIMQNCHLCEWRCGVNRLKGEKGVCQLGATAYVASAFLHMGEEAPLVPSGTIFFTSCSFKCVFCQNWDISTFPENGRPVSPKDLALIAESLRARGARNINYVGGNPDQQLYTIIKSLKFMKSNVPLLWNSNMYLSIEAMTILRDFIDIWLPDFKYGNDDCAFRLSKVKNYFGVVSRNHKIACNSGDIIIRHLVLPNHVECCTRVVLEWIAKNCPNALVNVMDQYHPEHLVLKYPEKYKDVARRLTIEEIHRAYSIADSLGIVYKPIS